MSNHPSYSWKSYFVVQADYQQWANDRLFAALGQMDPGLLINQQGMTFASIQHTVDHLLLTSQLWFARFQGEVFDRDINQLAYRDWNRLIEVTQELARALQLWLEQCENEFFEQKLTYFTNKDEPQQMWVRDVLTHMMAYQVHYRGQISAVITRLGYRSLEMDYGYYKREMDAYRERLGPIL